MHETIIARAGEIIAGKLGIHGYCTLAQTDLDGYPTAATISPSRTEGIKWVTLCTGMGSNWVKRARVDSRACLCFNADSPLLYNITLVGDLEIVEDPAVRREMWYDGMGTYYTGPDDPGFCVLRFNTRRYSILIDEQQGTVRGTL